MRPERSPGPLRHNGLPYSGINVLMLWSEAMDKGYTAPIWMTFRQAKELGAHVRKGEHGSSGCVRQHLHAGPKPTKTPARKWSGISPS